jgi:hypothetical protein
MLSRRRQFAYATRVLALVALFARPVFAQVPPLQGLSLEAAIDALEDAGLTVFYSSDLVKRSMWVYAQPRATALREALDEMLAPFGLTTRAGPRDSVLVVRAQFPREPARAVSGERPRVEPVLEPQPIEEMIVAASRYELAGGLDASAIRLWSGEIEDLPDLGDDALRAVHRLPGAANNGFSARANVRGGEAGETLVRFDKLRLYDPFHLESFQSVFGTVDPRVVSSMDVYTGGFTALYGDRMSGVVDIASLTPPEDRYHEVGASFFNTSALSSGRFADGDGEWLASLRRGNLDLLYNAFSAHPERPRYVDAFAKVGYRLDERLAFTLNTLYFRDNIKLSDDLDAEERAISNDEDRYSWVRLDHTIGAQWTGATLVSRASFSSDRHGTVNKEGISSGSLSDYREFTIEALQSEWSWQSSDLLLVQFGGVLRNARGRYDYRDAAEFALLFDARGAPSEPTRTRAIELAPRGREAALYGSVRYRPTERLTADVGLRWHRETLAPPGDGGLFEPRIGLRYELGERTHVRASSGRFHQPQSINEVQVSDGVAMFFGPQLAKHTVIGVEHVFAGGISLRIEAYEKEMHDLRPRFESLLHTLTLLPELKPDRVRIAPSAARARGVELLVSRSLQDRLAWWAGFARSSAKDLIDGAEVFRSWDQTDAVTGGMNWEGARWSVAAALAYRSGWPVTAPAGLDTAGAVPVVLVGPVNSDRVDFYRTVDLRAARTFDVERCDLSVFLELNNVFGRRNRCCTEYQIELDEAGDPILELSAVDYLPFVPSIGFVWRF